MTEGKANTKNRVIKMIIRIALIAGGLFVAMLYSAPLVARIVNAGNFFGLGVAGVMILCGIFINPISTFIKHLWESGKGKAIIISVTAVLLIGITMFTATLASIISHAQYTAQNETTVIVLGCRIWGSTPSRALIARTKAASDYLEKNPDAVVIVSGGQGPDENLSEAEAMRNLIVEAGIDESRIYIEDKSTSTDENIAFSKKIIEENNLSTNIAVATSDYHQKRAQMICAKNGLNSTSLPSKSSKFSSPTFYTREVFGVWVQWLKLLGK